MFKKKNKEEAETIEEPEIHKSKRMLELEKMEDELEEKELKDKKRIKILLIPVVIILIFIIVFVGSREGRYEGNCRKILKLYIKENYKVDIKSYEVLKITQDSRDFSETYYDSIVYKIVDKDDKKYKVVLNLYENDVSKYVKDIDNIKVKELDICDYRDKKEHCNY